MNVNDRSSGKVDGIIMRTEIWCLKNRYDGEGGVILNSFDIVYALKLGRVEWTPCDEVVIEKKI